jgi:mono/diheme cytochrome c family protein
MKLIRLGLLGSALLQLACNAGDGGGAAPDRRTVSPPDEQTSEPTAPDPSGGDPMRPGAPTSPIDPGFQLPTDTREPVSAASPPPMISGGTLIIARDGYTAIAADPDRDRVSFVDLRSGQVLGHLALEAGDEPGRLAEDAAGRVHVALRGANALASIDIASRSLLARRDTCAAPRGVAYDASADLLHVACASGRLMSLPAEGDEVVRDLAVGPDLRDVVVQGERLLVSQFKSAALLELDSAGDVVGEYQPAAVHQNVALGEELFNGTAHMRTFDASLARRTIAMKDGRTLILHERSMVDEVDIDDPHDGDGSTAPDPGLTGGGYGSGDSCQSIVQTAVSLVDADGNILQSSSLAGAVLAVDAAASPDGTTIAVANAGNRDLASPTAGMFIGPEGTLPGTFGNGALATGSISLINTGEPFHSDAELGDSCMFNSLAVPGQPTAVAYAPDGTLVVQSREPAGLILVSSSTPRMIALGGGSRLDTGHELFHRDAGGGLACASCHGEGGDDGHVWQFKDLGPRRTQTVNIGLAGTEPFHWSGDMDDLSMIMDKVFVTRMGGAPQSDARKAALASWLFAQHPPAAPRAADDAAALRGKELFESEGVGCAGCHNGEKLTNNDSVDVGTGEVLQVPSLVRVAYRTPFIHDGCASTLRDRFDPECGGSRHGDVSGLTGDELDDLIAYLETL